MRSLAAAWALVAMAALVVDPAYVSSASPADTEGQCTFLLNAPAVVQRSGTNYVKVSVEPGRCDWVATLNNSTVCISIHGDGSAGQCASAGGRNPAVLYYTYRPGATYVVTGQGCGDIIDPPHTVCQSIGPSRFTL